MQTLAIYKHYNIQLQDIIITSEYPSFGKKIFFDKIDQIALLVDNRKTDEHFN